MKRLTNTFKQRFHVLLSVIILFSCDDHEMTMNKPAWGNYYPMIPGSQWKYVSKSGCYWPDSETCYDTTTFFVGGDPVKWDSEFKPVSRYYGTVKWIKVKGNQYFTMAPYIPVYMFLDINRSLNESWSCASEYSKEEFTITAVNSVETVNGIRYENVVKVLRVYSWWDHTLNDFDELYRSYHYYARGVGEIMTYYPHSASSENDDVIISLLSYYKPQ